MSDTGNRRNKRSKRLKTPSAEREMNINQVETPNTGSETLSNSNVSIQENVGDFNSGAQLSEPSQVSNET